MKHERFAAIDMGSNTFRLLIASPGQNPPWHTLHYEHRIVRLGEGLHHTGRLSEQGMQRALEALASFAASLRAHDVPLHHVRAVATAAVREAANGRLFAEQALEKTGIAIDIIDGEAEAELSLAGAAAILDERVREDFLLFDIGGGSTEFIRAREQHCLDAFSCKLGVVRLVEAHLRSDPPSASDYADMIEAANKHLDDVLTSWHGASAPRHLVGTAGTVTTLAATALNLYPYDAQRINNYHMSWTTFERLRDHLLCLSHADRQRIRTIEPGRADLIIAGCAIVEAVMQRWAYPEMVVVDAGLLEGAWLSISRYHTATYSSARLRT